MTNSKQKIQAVDLRKRGLTYSEILKVIPIAKSTLSLWLKSVKLTKQQIHQISTKKLLSAHRGGQIRRDQRLQITNEIKNKAKLEIGNISYKNLWLIGTMLYWAEGAKDRIDRHSQSLIFSNSDPLMIRIFLKWLREILNIPEEDIKFEIYIHNTHKATIDMVKDYWANTTGYSLVKFDKIYFKHNKINTKRKNVGESYKGLLRVKVVKSTNLNRKISGWIEGVCINCGVV